MKKLSLICILATLMTGEVAFAKEEVFTREELTCEALLPSGSVTIIINNNVNDQPISLNLEIQMKGQADHYQGALDVSIYNPQTLDLVAFGALTADPALPSTTIQGSLEENDHGFIILSLYARADHRIEYGYGNPLRCTKVQSQL